MQTGVLLGPEARAPRPRPVFSFPSSLPLLSSSFSMDGWSSDSVDSSAPHSYMWRDIRCSYDANMSGRGGKQVEIEVRKGEREGGGAGRERGKEAPEGKGSEKGMRKRGKSGGRDRKKAKLLS